MEIRGLPLPDAHILFISGCNEGAMYTAQGNFVNQIHDSRVTGLALSEHGLAWVDFTGLVNAIYTTHNGQALRTELSDKVLDTHDLTEVKDGYLLGLTQTNEVLKISFEATPLERFTLAGEEDSSHINSVAEYRGRTIASAFGFFTKNREYKGQTHERGAVFDVATREILISGLSQPHSLNVLDDHTIYLCNSDKSEIRRYVDLKLDRVYPVPGYARGLAITEDRIYVGISCSRNVDQFKSELSENLYGHDVSKVVALNPDTGEQLSTIYLNTKEVYDVRCVSPRIAAKCLPIFTDFLLHRKPAPKVQDIPEEKADESEERIKQIELKLQAAQHDAESLRASKSFRIGNQIVRLASIFKAQRPIPSQPEE